ncbi:MAG TPA: hypothetical protein VE973_03935, partial [Candidatus Limnocylindria bacterium]|nr:hypothetical protein [Candidatus Limnocylindria bacterium]
LNPYKPFIEPKSGLQSLNRPASLPPTEKPNAANASFPGVKMPPPVPRPPVKLPNLKPPLEPMAAKKIPDAAPTFSPRPTMPAAAQTPIKPSPAPFVDPNVKDLLKQALGQKSEADSKSVSGGLSFGQTSDQTKQETLSSIKEHIEQTKTLVRTPKGLTTAIIETLPDLTRLTLRILDSEDFNSLLKKIKNLIAKYGYHEVVFNVEKSPLYQNYIKTGSELLSNDNSFEKMENEPSLERHLSREQFEKLTDLLSQMQEG